MLSDTHPKMEALQIELLRKTPPWRKVEMLGQMYETTKQLALVGLRHRHPEASEAELRRRLADLLLGPQLAERVYGPLRPIKEDDEDVD
ncbi:MAG: hypothetical protein MAG431_00378 [Chloroflexi bacterium]|nr:hypothetical protein [Chloroflexota bacterium]